MCDRTMKLQRKVADGKTKCNNEMVSGNAIVQSIRNGRWKSANMLFGLRKSLFEKFSLGKMLNVWSYRSVLHWARCPYPRVKRICGSCCSCSKFDDEMHHLCYVAQKCACSMAPSEYGVAISSFRCWAVFAQCLCSMFSLTSYCVVSWM